MKVQDEIERQLFFASTEIMVGNGKNTPFWEAKWVNGAAPRDLAPNLYKREKYKYRTVHKEIQNFNWIRNLHNIDSQTLMEEYVLLFSALATVTLTQEEDQISWRWTANGVYSASSAYDIQFTESYTRFKPAYLWKAYTEPRCQFFAWLALHDRALTTDNLAERNWPHNENCMLCYCHFETTTHLLTLCNYTEAVWNMIAAKMQMPNFMHMGAATGPNAWVTKLAKTGSKHERNMKLGVLFYFWWNIWKERNRRTFEGQERSVPCLATQILDDIKQYHTASLHHPQDEHN